MRYLGMVTWQSTSPHIKDICSTEMTARVLKRIFNKQISHLVLDFQARHEKNLRETRIIEEQMQSLTNPHRGIMQVG